MLQSVSRSDGPASVQSAEIFNSLCVLFNALLCQILRHRVIILIYLYWTIYYLMTTHWFTTYISFSLFVCCAYFRCFLTSLLPNCSVYVTPGLILYLCFVRIMSNLYVVNWCWNGQCFIKPFICSEWYFTCLQNDCCYHNHYYFTVCTQWRVGVYVQYIQGPLWKGSRDCTHNCSPNEETAIIKTPWRVSQTKRCLD